MAWQRRNLGQVVCFDTFNIPEINLREGPLRRKPCFFYKTVIVSKCFKMLRFCNMSPVYVICTLSRYIYITPSPFATPSSRSRTGCRLTPSVSLTLDPPCTTFHMKNHYVSHEKPFSLTSFSSDIMEPLSSRHSPFESDSAI